MEKGADIDGIAYRNYKNFGAMNVTSWRVNTPKIHDSCVGCGLCETYCPEKAITMNDRKPAIEYTFCKGCGICAYECPTESIEMIREAS